MIDEALVRETLRESLGSALAEDAAFCGGVTRLLRSYAPYKDTFAGLARRVEDYLFNALYERLGPGMSVQLDDGVRRMVRMADLPALADQALYPFFASLKPYSVNYEHLHAYWMETGSFAAMRALYCSFADFLPVQDQRLIERVVKENPPAGRQAAWLRSKEDQES